jgi:RND superfamily putative drug exporter
MFSLLGKGVARFWPFVLGGWCLLLVLLWLTAPRWEAVTKAGEVEFLPAHSPSRRGDELFRKAFPDSYTASSVVLALSREGAELAERDRSFIADVLTPRLEDLADDEDLAPILGATRSLADRGVGALLVSPDRRATLVLVELATPFIDRRNARVVAKIEDVVDTLRGEHKVPDGLEVAVTGSATAGRDLLRAEGEGARAIEVWTVVVVVVLLLLLYRAPVAALVPLVTVFLSVEVSLRLLALLAWTGWLAPDRDARIFINVLVYGAGVDYCVFLMARYREEREHGADAGQASAAAVGQVGSAITASAATVIFGIGMLAFARFGKMHEAGLAIPIAFAVVLAATLTFTAALLRVAGRWTFWPQARAGRPGEAPSRHLLSNLWKKAGRALLRRPGMIWLASVAAMVPFVVVALVHYDDQNFNPVSELPRDVPSVVGARALERSFPPGTLAPVTVLVKDDQVDFGYHKGVALIDRLTDRLREQAGDLGLRDVRSVAHPLGITAAGQKALTEQGDSRRDAQARIRQQAVDYYVSRHGSWKGHVTRLELTLDTDPFSRPALDNLDRVEAGIRDALPADLHGPEVEVCGPTASARDLAVVKQGDQWRIQILVPAVVFVLLLIILHRVGISLYLVLSVLFSYLATLGVTFVVFWLLDREGFSGLDWKVPIFLFTILVAVGEDYNIFLVTRIKEEQDRHGPLEAIPVALARTGKVISSCGFIMAGTFATLLSSTMLAMKQLGFALALGILLDTLLVRPILVPTFLVLLQQGRLGRLGQYLALGQPQAPPRRAA